MAAVDDNREEAAIALIPWRQLCNVTASDVKVAAFEDRVTDTLGSFNYYVTLILYNFYPSHLSWSLSPALTVLS